MGSQEGPCRVYGVIAEIQGLVCYRVRVASQAVWRQLVDHVQDGTQYLYPTSAKGRRVAHKFWRTLSHYLTAFPLQLLPIPDHHSSSTFQVVVTLHESDEMWGIDSVILILCMYCFVYVLYLVFYLLLAVCACSVHVCTWPFVCGCLFDLNLPVLIHCIPFFRISF